MIHVIAKESSASEHEHIALGFALLDDNDVARQTDSGSFSRGKTYFRGRRIYNGVRRSATLRARCRGSSGGPYHVEATLATSDQPVKNNPIAYSCDCPRGGFCKHVVALLLTWIDNPDAFEVRPPIAEMLAGKSSEDLIGMIELFLKVNPDLEKLLELPVPIKSPPSDAPIDEAAIRRQIAAALQEAGENDDYDEYHGYGRGGRYDEYYGYDEEADEAGTRAAAALEPLIARAEAHVASGFWRNAFLLAATLAEDLAPELDTFDDENGELDEVVIRADAALASCLDAQAGLPAEARLTHKERGRLIGALLTVWGHDLEGRLDLSQAGTAAIGRSGTQEEQQAVADRVRSVLKGATGNSSQDSWLKRSAIGFLSLLKGDAGLSDEELLTEYRNAELWDESAALLIEMGRVDEAVHLASRHLPATTGLLPFANRLIETGDPKRIAQAISLVDDRLWEREGQHLPDDQALRQWLEARYAEHGHPEKALELAKGRFKATPNQVTYSAVKSIALRPDQPGDPWPELRPTLLSALEKQGSWIDLIEIHLEDGEVGKAIAAVKEGDKPQKSKPGMFGYHWTASSHGYDVKVAAVAEADFPDFAIGVYRKRAEAEIAARQRQAYQRAAGYLVRVMRTLEAHGRGEEWTALIAEIRERNKSLRALREELDALGLK